MCRNSASIKRKGDGSNPAGAIERMHVTSSNFKIQKINKEPPKVLFSSGIRGAEFKSVYNFSAQ